MKFLALDTSTERGVIGLAASPDHEFVSMTDADRRHGRDLIPKLAATVSAAGLRLQDIDVIAVGLGPGSYTGLRVGLTAAKTLAFATQASLIGLDSLEAIAYNVTSYGSRITVIADAQRGRLYVAEYARESSGRLVATRACQVELATAWLERFEPGTTVVGPALNSPRIRTMLPVECTIADDALNYPQGRELVQLARETWSTGRRDDPWTLEPRYLRESSAEEQWKSRPPAPSL